LTDKRIAVVTRQSGHHTNDNLIFDIGCGDASFAKAFALSAKKVVGILPTEEECERVSATAELTGIEIVQGRTDSINTAILRFGYPDLIYCNSVLHGLGFDASAVKASFAHFSNNQKKNVLLYVGEIHKPLSWRAETMVCLSKNTSGGASVKHAIDQQ